MNTFQAMLCHIGRHGCCPVKIGSDGSLCEVRNDEQPTAEPPTT
jgi:hypothetical protein